MTALSAVVSGAAELKTTINGVPFELGKLPCSRASA